MTHILGRAIDATFSLATGMKERLRLPLMIPTKPGGWPGKKIRSPLVNLLTVLILVTLPGSSRSASANVIIQCTFSGEMVGYQPTEVPPLADPEAVWSRPGGGIWSSDATFEFEPGSKQVVMKWNDEKIPAQILLKFRPSWISARTVDAEITRTWRFRFQHVSPSRDYSRIDVMDAKAEFSRESRTSEASVAFHGRGLCYGFRPCGAESSPDHCTGQGLCFDRQKQCGRLR